jgi:hypothetical protein
VRAAFGARNFIERGEMPCGIFEPALIRAIDQRNANAATPSTTRVPDTIEAFAAPGNGRICASMLPGLRFLFAAIVLAISVLVFGLGAAALLRAAHEQFAANPTWRAPPEPVFLRADTTPVLAVLQVAPAAPAAAAPAEPSVAAEPEQPTTPAPAVQDDSKPAEIAAADAPAAAEPAATDAKPEVTAETPVATETTTAAVEPPPPPAVEPPLVSAIEPPAHTDEPAPTIASAGEPAPALTAEPAIAAAPSEPISPPRSAAAEAPPREADAGTIKVAALGAQPAAVEHKPAAVPESRRSNKAAERDAAKRRLRAQRARQRRLRAAAALRARLAREAALVQQASFTLFAQQQTIAAPPAKQRH